MKAPSVAQLVPIDIIESIARYALDTHPNSDLDIVPGNQSTHLIRLAWVSRNWRHGALLEMARNVSYGFINSYNNGRMYVSKIIRPVPIELIKMFGAQRLMRSFYICVCSKCTFSNTKQVDAFAQILADIGTASLVTRLTLILAHETHSAGTMTDDEGILTVENTERVARLVGTHMPQVSSVTIVSMDEGVRIACDSFALLSRSFISGSKLKISSVNLHRVCMQPSEENYRISFEPLLEYSTPLQSLSLMYRGANRDTVASLSRAYRDSLQTLQLTVPSSYSEVGAVDIFGSTRNLQLPKLEELRVIVDGHLNSNQFVYLNDGSLAFPRLRRFICDCEFKCTEESGAPWSKEGMEEISIVTTCEDLDRLCESGIFGGSQYPRLRRINVNGKRGWGIREPEASCAQILALAVESGPEIESISIKEVFDSVYGIETAVAECKLSSLKLLDLSSVKVDIDQLLGLLEKFPRLAVLRINLQPLTNEGIPVCMTKRTIKAYAERQVASKLESVYFHTDMYRSNDLLHTGKTILLLAKTVRSIKNMYFEEQPQYYRCLSLIDEVIKAQHMRLFSGDERVASLCPKLFPIADPYPIDAFF